MYTIFLIFSSILNTKALKQSITKHGLFNVFLILIILLSFSASIETRAASIQMDNSQTCELLIGKGPVTHRLRQNADCEQPASSSEVGDQQNLSSEGSNTITSASSNPTTLWRVEPSVVEGREREIYDVAVDSSGNAYVTGTANPHSFTDYYAFVTKLDASGAELWTYSFTGELYWGYSICLGSSGNIYVAGEIDHDRIDNFDRDIFVAKLTNGGFLSWQKQLGDSNQGEYASDIACDSGGNVYITGNDNPFPQGDSTHINSNAFIAKLNIDSGNPIWVTYLDSEYHSAGIAISTDSSGNIYSTGFVQLSRDTKRNAFVARLNPNGQKSLYKILENTTEGDGITTDSMGGVYITGGDLEQHNYNTSDGFVIKLSSDGVIQWNTLIGTPGSDQGPGFNNLDVVYGISLIDDQIYITGSSQVVWGNPIDSVGQSFLAKLDRNGSLQWNTFLENVVAYPCCS